MRCHRARQRIEQLSGIISDIPENRDLNDHLNTCLSCVQYAKTEQILSNDLETLKTYNNSDSASFDTIIDQVESRLPQAAPQKSQELNIMKKIVNNISQKPRYGISMAIVIGIFLAVTLIPFKWEKTIGYRVAMAGVDKNLALDEYKMQILLDKLGIDGTEYIVDGCEKTCELTFSNLKSKNEVNILVSAFDEMGNCEIKEVKPINIDESGNIFKVINIGHHDESDFDALNNEEVSTFVVKTLTELNENCDGELYTIWVGDCDSDSQVTGGVYYSDGQTSGHIDEFGENVTISDICLQTVGVGAAASLTTYTFDEKNGLILLNKDGEKYEFDANNPEDIEKLKEFGFNFEDLSSLKCSTIDIVMRDADGKDDDHESANTAKSESDDLIPNEYSLHQNYPNPFNPSTTIKYYLRKVNTVTIEIFNNNGQKVKTLVNETQSAGEYSIIWHGTNDNGQKVASGIYMYRMTAGEFTESKKMSLLK